MLTKGRVTLYMYQLTLGGLEVSRSSVACEPVVPLLPLLIRLLWREHKRCELTDQSHPSNYQHCMQLLTGSLHVGRPPAGMPGSLGNRQSAVSGRNMARELEHC